MVSSCREPKIAIKTSSYKKRSGGRCAWQYGKGVSGDGYRS